MLFRFLDGKGGSDDSGSIVVKSLEVNAEDQSSFVSMAKIASADPNFLVNMTNSTTDQADLDSNTLAVLVDDEEDPAEALGDPIPIIQGNYVMAPASFYDESQANLKYGIFKYTVQSGDTPSSIATSFGVSTYTVLWANNMKVGDYIRPGQDLEILPVTGVKHIVKKGDTVEKVANLYKADKDEVIAFNSLPADGIFPEGSEGKMLIVPNGETAAPLKPRVVAPPRDSNERKVVSTAKSSSTFKNPLGSHRFVFGQCTYYVASKVYVPWSGHAKSWLTNARAFGYETGKTPVVGSIMVTTENKWYGHVALVEGVNGDKVTISEMNYVGWNRTSVRVLDINSRVIRGYIYMK
ncbi:MAG: LysM peptidoglycan-binding domain-containing protein [Candidatus Paceibacterota bacterium]